MKICLLLAILLAAAFASELEEITSELKELSANLSHPLDDRRFRQQQELKIPVALADREVLLKRTTDWVTIGYNSLRHSKTLFEDVELDFKWLNEPYVHKMGRVAVMEFFIELYKRTGDLCLPAPGEPHTFHNLIDSKLFSGPNDNLYASCKIYIRFCNGRLLTFLIKGTLTETTEPAEQLYGIKYMQIYPGTMDLPVRNGTQEKMYFDYLYVEEDMFKRAIREPFRDQGRVDGYYSNDRWLDMQAMDDNKTILYPCFCTSQFNLRGENATKENVIEFYRRTENATGGWNWGFNGDRARTNPSFEILKEGHIYTQFNMTTVYGRTWKIRFVIKEDYAPFPLGERYSWQVHELRLDEVSPIYNR